MDLDIDNYTDTELLNVLKIDHLHITTSILQELILNKIQKIKRARDDQLPENRELLVEFYLNIFMRLSTNLNINRNEEINKLQPKLQQSEVVQESNNFVLKHDNLKSTNTFNLTAKPGVVNPLTINTIKKMLNLNTRFRNNYTTTSSSDFIFDLPYPIKKVISMNIVDIQIAPTVYTYSSKLGSNSFIITSSGVKTTIDISNGAYREEELVDAINNSLQDKGLGNIEVSIDCNSFLTTIRSIDGSNFDLDFNYYKDDCPQILSNINKDQLTLGWLLGFRGNYLSKISSIRNNKGCYVKNQVDISNNYSGSNSYTGEAINDNHFNKYILISIDDYQNNHNSSFINPFQFESQADNNILGKIHAYGEDNHPYTKHDMTSPKRIYFGPTDITRLHIILYDEVGRILDLNNADYALTLEFEIIYDI